MECTSSRKCPMHGSTCVPRDNGPKLYALLDPFEALGIDLCPICGAEVFITGRTTDGRLVGSCKDAFTQAQWNDDEE